jgi:plastocyanin
LLLLFCIGMMAACGGTSSNPSPMTPTPPVQPSPGPPQPAVVTITATGFSPSEVSTPVGSRVTFVNSDSRPHDLLGGPDHTRLDCAEVDVVGFLVPGQRRETAVFTAARTCEFHDHNNLGNRAFQGRIIVQ